MARRPNRFQLPLPFADSPAKRSRIDAGIATTLGALLKQDLTFQGAKTDYATHRLHAFAAKFPPQLPHLFIDELTRPGEWVCDPMAGSGTTTVESLLMGRNSVAIDIDPLAVLITHGKTSTIDLDQTAKVGFEVIRRAERRFRASSKNGLQRDYSPEAIRFFEFWFKEQTIHELHVLVSEIQRVTDPPVQAFLSVVLSSAIINKNGTLTFARDLAHSRPHRDMHKRIDRSAIELFAQRFEFALDSVAHLIGTNFNPLVARGDVRDLPLENDSMDLIVTSPPYAANAIDYMRANKFSLIWFGEDPKSLSELRRRYIGSEVRPRYLGCNSRSGEKVISQLAKEDVDRAGVVSHYFQDMEVALREMYRVIKPTRAVVLVVGSSVIRGIDIKVPRVLSELADKVGFEVIGVNTRRIMRNARMMPISHSSSKSGIEARMHEEGVIGLVKPDWRDADADA